MEKMIYELILEVKKLKNSINNLEEKLEEIEKGLHVKKGEQITTTIDSNRCSEWEKVKIVLKVQMKDVSYNTWIEPICVIKLDGVAIKLAVPSEFHKGIVKERYLNEIKNAILNVTGREYKIEISVIKILESKSEIYSIDTANKNKFIPCKVNSKYLFKNMVVGKNNELAYKSALKVAKSPGEDMRLLYIYGEAGMGKTHLLNSINNYIVENSKSLKVINITIYKFINIYAMMKRHEIKFKSYVRLFPNQDTMPKGRLGNLIELPMQKSARKNNNNVLCSFLTENKIDFSWDDKTYIGKPIRVEFNGQLWEEQIVAVDTMLKYDKGVLSATTAFGKTVIGAKLIAERKVNTFIIVHAQQLLEQWKERLKQFLIINEVLSIDDTKKRGRKKNISIIGQICVGKNILSGIIDVATMQSLVRK
ncbi:DnaA ATPase domain-containing protein [Clostridium estertheticum]|uniref:DnaA ATPase domain-containing protein n=1 Tax=Clostridium estertheticum TaxID=238834 RepID=UPI00299EFB89|nr:DnaA/Hda family protein [Clostridium estertheticum]